MEKSTGTGGTVQVPQLWCPKVKGLRLREGRLISGQLESRLGRTCHPLGLEVGVGERESQGQFLGL